jgi:hypothetical protein
MVDEGGFGQDLRDFGISGLTGFGSHGGAEARRAEVGDGRKIWARKIGTTKDTKGGVGRKAERGSHEGTRARRGEGL